MSSSAKPNFASGLTGSGPAKPGPSPGSFREAKFVHNQWRPSPAAARRGTTVLEVLMACGVLVMFLTVAMQVVVPCLRLTVTNARRTGLQQQAASAGERIERDLRRAAMAGIAIGTGVVTVHRLQEVRFSGTPVWETHLQIYSLAEHRLSRREGENVPNEHAFHPEAGALDALRTAGGGETLARGVDTFVLERAPEGFYGLTLKLTDGTDACCLQRTLYLRNH